MIKELGFVRVGAIVPKLKVANTEFNSTEIIKQIKKASKQGVDIVTTPELAITGYTCADLFKQDVLIDSALLSLKKIIDETEKLDIISIIGVPLKKGNQLFNCAAVIYKGDVLAIYPKKINLNSNINSNINSTTSKINIFGKEIPFGTNIILEDESDSNISFSVNICDDIWNSSKYTINNALNGAMIIFNPTASNEIVGKYDYRKQLVNVESGKNICAYVYCSAGVNESSTDLVFSGHSIISENGYLLEENDRFDFESNLIYKDIDILRLKNDRMNNINFIDSINKEEYLHITFKSLKNIQINNLERIKEKYKIAREISEYPFIPSNDLLRDERCKEIIDIQSSGLAKRLLHIGCKKTVIGLSGGQDSTLAFLVIIEAYKKLNIDNSNIIAITMPGFGTTGRTYENACKLAKAYGVILREISIKEACTVHMKDIGVDEKDKDITYENLQARERTQILMDVANKENAIVIGTGDLSELALGWCTYNGDHMSMYAVNSDIPKTLVRYLIKWIADTKFDTKSETKNREILYDILDTPISPELLPPDEYGKISQKTENSIGPYVLHDFFLYHFLRYGASPKKIYSLAKYVFEGKFENEEIKKWLKVFLKRFFSQQFKRSCIPDGPKVGSVGISPREDLRMPSDADVNIWLKELEEC